MKVNFYLIVLRNFQIELLRASGENLCPRSSSKKHSIISDLGKILALHSERLVIGKSDRRHLERAQKRTPPC